MTDLSRLHVLTIVVVFLTVMALGIGGVAAIGAAQEDADTGEGGLEEEPEPEETTVVAQVDENVRVLGYRYDAEREVFAVELENTGGSSTQVTVTEAISSSSSGAGTFGIEQIRLRGGDTVTVEVSAAMARGSVGVMITTPASMNAGQGTYLQETSSLGLFEGGATWADVRMGVITGIVATMLVIVLAAWAYLSSTYSASSEVSLS